VHVNMLLMYLREAARYLIFIAAAVALTYAGSSFSCARIDDAFRDMRPEIEAGQMLLISKRGADVERLHTGDLICFYHTSAHKVYSQAGHVVALPGDTFEADDRVLIVNGKRQNPGYAPSIERSTVPPIMVPRDHVLVTFAQAPRRKLDLSAHLVPVAAIKGRIIK
jgi:signal peptidase I